MTFEHYENTCVKLSKRLTIAYSTSFSWGIRAFASEYRQPIYSIYGWVRVADEIVDTFLDSDKKYLLDKFKKDTYEAIEHKLSTNPIIHSFQKVVNEYNIGHNLIDAFLKSMEMDLEETSHNRNDYDQYIYGSAEVVGLMCLNIFVGGNKEKYEELKESARMLGSAFQKVNFLRDIKSDLADRSRIYLPGVHHEMLINNTNKKELEFEIEKEFHEAYLGIKQLPIGVKLGVYSAYLYYLMLFKKIKRMDVKQLMSKRVRISNLYKLYLLFKCYFKVKVIKQT